MRNFPPTLRPPATLVPQWYRSPIAAPHAARKAAPVVARNRLQSFRSRTTLAPHARVAELADALDLGSSEETRGGSSPPSRTILSNGRRDVGANFRRSRLTRGARPPFG